MKINRIVFCLLAGWIAVVSVCRVAAEEIPEAGGLTVMQGVVRGVITWSQGSEVPDLSADSFYPEQADFAARRHTRADVQAKLRHTLWLSGLGAEIIFDPPDLRAGHVNLMTLRFLNGQDQPVSISTRARASETNWYLLATIDSVTVPAGNAKEITFEVTVPETTPNGKYTLYLEIDVDGLTIFVERPVRVNTPLPCKNTPLPPVIDGDLGEWDFEPVIWNVSEDTVAELRSMWSDEGLYLSANVRTPEINPGQGHTFWQADSVGIFLDPEAKGGLQFDRKVRQYWFMVQNLQGEPEAGLNGATRNEWAVPEYALKKTDFGYVLETFIPADQLPVSGHASAEWPPAAGERIGMDIKLNDPDAPESIGKYFSGGQLFGRAPYTQPWLWGWLELGERKQSGLVLRADTSKPDTSTYIPGEPVEIALSIEGMLPGQSDRQLQLRLTDGEDRLIKEETFSVQADDQGRWKAQFSAPADRLGLYRVWAQLDNGLQLQALGSRPKGYITYAVVPDPATRPLYPDTKSRFGIFGDYHSPYVMGLLGARWNNAWAADHSYPAWFWLRHEPNHPGEFKERLDKLRSTGQYPKHHRPDLVLKGGQPQPWTVYRLPCLFQVPPPWALIPESRQPHTGAIKPEAEEAWRNYCLLAGKTFAEYFPDRTERIYQISWEPQGLSKEYDGHMLRAYQIAYKALHEADPKALVIGPTSSAVVQSLAFEERLFAQGLGEYLDGFSCHPYMGFRKLERTPEEWGLIDALRRMKDLAAEHIGPDAPLFATESGFTSEADPAKERMHAQCVVRANLIILGEGFRFNYTFFPADIDAKGYAYGDFGLYYNLTDKMWLPEKMAPKTAVPAYAAMTWLIDGHASAGPVSGLPEKAWGYRFDGDDDRVYALWSDESQTISLPVASKRVEVFDWMGNSQGVMETQDGTLSVPICSDPVYVKCSLK